MLANFAKDTCDFATRSLFNLTYKCGRFCDCMTSYDKWSLGSYSVEFFSKPRYAIGPEVDSLYWEVGVFSEWGARRLRQSRPPIVMFFLGFERWYPAERIIGVV